MGCSGSKSGFDPAAPAASNQKSSRGVAPPVYYTKESVQALPENQKRKIESHNVAAREPQRLSSPQPYLDDSWKKEVITTQSSIKHANTNANKPATSSQQNLRETIKQTNVTEPKPPATPHSVIRTVPKPKPLVEEVSVAPSIATTFLRTSDVRFESQYQRGSNLGSGAFAEVFLGTHFASGNQYAIKKIDRTKMTWGGRDALQDEIENLRLVREGPNIVQLYEVYEEREYCYLVMELMQGGELFDRIIEKKTFTEKEARDVMRCILDGLQYMHAKRVVHRDLKPENLLLKSFSSDTEVKLADFGFAKHLATHNGCKTLCGTPGYLAPEILERWPAYDTKCDTWSAGVIMFLLLGGYLPFDSDDEDEVFDQTRNGDYAFHPDYFKGVSTTAKNLVTMMLTVNPSKRSSAHAALEHAWMRRKEKELKDRYLSVSRLRDSVVKDRNRHQGLGEANPDDRIGNLNRQYESYLTKRSDSMTVFTKQSVVSHPRDQNVIPEDSATGKPFLHFYDMGSMLGEGGFATVKRAKHRKTGQIVAVKDVDRTNLKEQGKNSLKDEVAALKLLRGGPHIVRLFDVFEEKTHTYIVMEVMKGGELLQRIVDKEVYTEREARELCKILFSAVDYMHKKSIAHRDLKPENLLLSEKNDDATIKIADFGFAKKVFKQNSLQTLCGTASYVAPEVLSLKWKGYDTKADMWSVGVIVYILLGGYAPFEGQLGDLARVIIDGKYEFHPEYWRHISSSAKELIKALLQVNPNKRITASEALISEWMVVEAESLISRDLTSAQSQIRKALPLNKVRGAVNAIIAANKLGEAGQLFTKGLIKDLGNSSEELKARKSKMPAPPRPKQVDGKIIEDSTSGKAFVELFEPEAQIGQGEFSVVLEATHKQSRIRYAVKRIDRRNLHPSDAVAVQDEIDALRTVAGCPQIVRLHDIYDEVDTTYLILENMRGGDLIDRIIRRQSYTEYDAKQVCEALLEGVKFCHKRRIANRNLKPENLLLVSPESDTEVKISDFGYAKKVIYPNSLRTQCGTEGYVAPEILQHNPSYDVSCDMWSLGVIIYILLGGYRPFRGTSKEVMRQIRYGEFEFHDTYWRHVSTDAKELIRRMLTVNPEDRITAKEALNSAWITADDDLLSHFDLSSNQDKLRGY